MLNLLGQNLLLLLCGTVTILFVVLVNAVVKPLFVHHKTKTRSKKKQKAEESSQQRQRWFYFAGLFLSILAAYGIRALISHLTDSDIPIGIALMLIPTTLSLAMLVALLVSTFSWRLRLFGIGCLVCSVLFSLLLINGYYRYYPTLASVFNINGATVLNTSPKQVLLSFTPPSDKTIRNNSSLEYSLTSITSQPTDGKIYSLNIPGTVSKFHARNAYVYVPAIYNNPTVISLPVVILTTGFPGTPSDWVNSGLQTTMDSFAKHHAGITPLIFVVDDAGSVTNDTECVDSARGNVETYLAIDVPNYIKANFNTETDPSHWAIGGLSMGGMCSVMLALRHPNVYHYFLDYGGEVGPEVGNTSKTIKTLFNGSFTAWQQHQPDYLLHSHSYKGMGGFFGVGSEDERKVTDAAAELSAGAQKAGIETIYETVSGQHTFSVWQESFKLSLPWVSNRIGATECQTTCY